VACLQLDRGANIETKTASGKTSLHAAASKGYERLACLLLDRGADLEAGGHVSVVRLLLDRGANIEAKNEVGVKRLEGIRAWYGYLLTRGPISRVRTRKV
jgi:ankyrin repeat protein